MDLVPIINLLRRRLEVPLPKFEITDPGTARLNVHCISGNKKGFLDLGNFNLLTHSLQIGLILTKTFIFISQHKYKVINDHL
jgi:hypothetical protein